MLSNKDRPTSARRTWRWCFGSVVATLIIVAIVGSWMIYQGIATSLQAEENLHATLFTIQLVEHFVHEHGQWPKSWAELEQVAVSADSPSPQNGELNVVRIGGAHGYDWPAQSAQLQKRVIIDFSADPNTIIQQSPLQFQAIKPNGPYYEYRDYGYVDSLQKTLKNAATNQ